MNLRALLAQAQQQLAAALGLPADEARSEAQILLRAALGDVSRAWLLAHDSDTLTSAQDHTYQQLLARRLAGEPVAYILGRREFYGLEFTLTPDVLIPRPDTETLVEAALAHIPLTPSPHPSPASGRGSKFRVLDLGTGSGAIAIALAVHRPLAEVVAVDRSERALAVARGNAQALHAGNLQLRQSDWFSALAGEKFDCIVSNPPYIAQDDEHLNQGDLRFEPRSALASGTDGLDDIRRIVAEAPQYLNQNGWLLLEHGYDQAEQVAQLLQAAGYTHTGHAADLAGIRRVTYGRLV